MAGNIKGIVVEIGGDTSKLQSALKQVNKVTSSLQSELRQVDKLIKFNPNNVTLLSQRQKILKEEITATSQKLKELIQHQNEVKKSGVELTEDQLKNYRALQREIIATTNQLSQYMQEASRINSVGQAITKLGESFSSLGNKISEAGKKVSVLSGAVAGIGLIGVKYNAQLETYTKAFSTFLNSAEKGQTAVQKIIDMSKTSPFNTASLVKANQMLITTGIEAEESRKTINALADAIALTGGDNYTLERMASNLQQIQNVGKASAMDIRQFGMAGIDIYGLLADSIGVSTAKVKEMDITYEQLSKALQKGASEGGKYFKGQEAMADTLNGRISKLKKTFEELVGELTESLSPIIKEITDKLQGLIDWFKGLSDSQKEMILKVGLLIAVLGPALIIVGKIITTIGLIISKIGLVISFIGKAIAIIKVIGAVLLASVSAPILIVIGVVGALIAVFVLLYTKCEWFRDGVHAVLEAIKTFFINVFTAIGKFFTETIPAWIEGAKEILSNLPYYIGYVIGLLLGKIVQFGIDVFNWVRTKVPEIINNIVTFFKELPRKNMGGTKNCNTKICRVLY